MVFFLGKVVFYTSFKGFKAYTHRSRSKHFPPIPNSLVATIPFTKLEKYKTFSLRSNMCYKLNPFANMLGHYIPSLPCESKTYTLLLLLSRDNKF